jgi:hypothetical protein
VSIFLLQVQFSPVTIFESGTPRPSNSIWRFLPFVLPGRWISSNSFFCMRSFCHSTIYTLPRPCYSFNIIIFCQSFLPQCKKKAFTLSSCKMGENGTGTTKPFILGRLATDNRFAKQT